MWKDNSGLLYKLKIRKILLDEIENPVIMETNGGTGVIYSKLYSDYQCGVVFEKQLEKAAVLVLKRPTWAVYCGDNLKAISAGIGFHNTINFFDVDPYGEPWPIIYSIFENTDKLPDKFGIAVNDGLRRYLLIGRGWKSPHVTEWVDKFGNDSIARRYPEIVQEKIDGIAEKNGYTLSKWTLVEHGYQNQQLNYAAVLEKK